MCSTFEGRAVLAWGGGVRLWGARSDWLTLSDTRLSANWSVCRGVEFVIVLRWPAFLTASIFLYVYHIGTNVSIF